MRREYVRWMDSLGHSKPTHLLIVAIVAIVLIVVVLIVVVLIVVVLIVEVVIVEVVLIVIIHALIAFKIYKPIKIIHTHRQPPLNWFTCTVHCNRPRESGFASGEGVRYCSFPARRW